MDEAKSEAARLTRSLAGARTIDETIRRLGPPDRDTSAQQPLITGDDVPRILVWSHVSAHWAVRVCAWDDGRFNTQIEQLASWSR